MTKMEEQNVSGGESVILHLDDWEYLEDLSKDPIGSQNFIWSSPKSKNVDYKVDHPVFSNDDNFNLYWEIEFQDISQDNFEMYGKSVIIKKNRIFWLMLILFCCSYLIVRKVIV